VLELGRHAADAVPAPLAACQIGRVRLGGIGLEGRRGERARDAEAVVRAENVHVQVGALAERRRDRSLEQRARPVRVRAIAVEVGADEGRLHLPRAEQRARLEDLAAHPPAREVLLISDERVGEGRPAHES
jgi:hypothetical protein